MEIVKAAAAVFFGFCSGVVIAGGVFAFIAIIGIVPRLAQKTGTQHNSTLYEECIMAGGILGAFAELDCLRIPVGPVVTVLMSFCGGVFFGCLAMSLAEVLDVIPILTRRVNVQQGVFFFVLCIALGKLVGSLAYFLIPGFYKSI